ncbi:hypothetical protein ACF8FG_20675 [Pseudomonas sp. YQ_6]|uniref:hypothetical protein n=1 Tax=Pseudomonas sp. YQ_6 TaxID=3367230 RepID=UPI00370C7048
MLAVKIKLTHWLLTFSSKFPWLVPSLLRFVGKDYGRQESETMRRIYLEENRTVTASMFDGKISWKGISFISEIRREDLRRVHKWMSGQSRAAGNYSSYHEQGVKSKDLVGAGYNNLGYVSFDRPSMFSVGTISISAALPKSCYITLLRLKNGACYISLYVDFSEDVNSRVFDVDVRHIKRYSIFQSFNPLSPKFALIESHDRRSVIEEYLYRKANEVVDEANQAVNTLLDVWGLKLKLHNFSTVADFFREGSGSYFCDSSSPQDEESDAHVIIDRSKGRFLTSALSEDPTEEYIENYIPKDLGVDAIYLKSQVSSEVEPFDRYDCKSIGVTDSYSFALILVAIYSQFKRCTHEVSPVFISFNKKVERDLKRLLDAELELNIVEERLSAVEDGLHWCEESFKKFIRGRISGIRSHVSSLRGSIEKRRNLNDGKLQVKNLIWMRRYSVMVFILVLVQIALSLLNVDWTDDGRSKNPIYINLFHDEK